jgi:CheY-like chemotaxis protein
MIQEVVDTIRPIVEQNANVLEVQYGDNLGSMYADLTKTRQALFNLLSNACKFTEAGTITLTVEREMNGAGQRAAPAGGDDLPGQDYIIFRVMDTGIGMTKEQIQYLFEAFTQADASTTRRYGGTGLGLAISQRFCQMMGGSLSVESGLNQGSTFTIRLPGHVIDSQAKATTTAGVTITEAAGETTLTTNGHNLILVIDDDPTTQDLLRRHLSKEGFQVQIASDGETGLELARKIQPIAITLDVMMPGMDGWAVLTKLKADPALSDIPVIMLTIVNEKNMGYTLGASDYLTKPIDRERLISLLQKYQCSKPCCQILLVEDDTTTREMVRRMLQKQGWEVVEAENGRAGLERVNEDMPELILLDLMMPEMDGFQFITELRRKPAWRSIPVIVITAMDLSPEDRRRLNGYVKHILQKGAYSRSELLREVRDLVNASLAQFQNAL